MDSHPGLSGRALVATHVILFLAIALSLPASAQSTRYVSPTGSDIENDCVENPCRTIGSALDIAAPGDTIALSAGTFYEAGLVLADDVTIVGSGQSATVIDGDGVDGTRTYFLAAVENALTEAKRHVEMTAGKQAAYGELARTAVSNAQAEWYSTSAADGFVFRIEKGVAATIEGVTVRDGGGFSSDVTYGGIVNDGVLLVRQSIIEHNVAYHADLDRLDDHGRGGGLWNRGTLTVEGSTIRGNVAAGFTLSGGEGGGIFSEGSLTVRGSTIEENEAWDAQDFCRGGGIVNGGEASIESSRIVGNRADCFEGGAGGGVYNSGSLHIEGSTISENSATSAWEYLAGNGGGIASRGELVVVNSTISRNESGAGGGVFSSGQTQLLSTTVTENEAVDRPYAPGEGGGVSHRDGRITLWNSILAGNTAGDDASAGTADCSLSGAVTSDYLLSGEGTGCPTGATTVAPRNAVAEIFAEAAGPYTYAPRAGSPAIDAGSCALPQDGAIATDQEGSTRPFDDPSVSNAADGCDIGAIELQQGTGEKSSEPLAASTEDQLPYSLQLDQNYPNPFHSSTRIGFSVPKAAHTRLVVYDLSGREVARLVDATLARGEHEVQWDAAGLSSGGYLCRLTVDGSSETRSLVIIR